MAEESERAGLISQFVAVTGLDTERSRFYLESAGWQLDVAIEGFYDDDGIDDIRDDPNVNSARLPTSLNPPSQPTISKAPSSAQSTEKPTTQRQSRFATINDLQSSSDSSEEEGEAFYAGGSEHGGGQQVLGPPKKKEPSSEIVKNIFKSAKEHGAEEATDTGSEARRRRPDGSAFHGTGYRLGDTEGTPSDVVMGSLRQNTRSTDAVLKFWKNGFSVDDGPLRDFQDPANREFIADIKKGEVPAELIKLAKGAEVNLSMEDHRDEDYVKPKTVMKPFSGEGHMLGSPAPTVASQPTSLQSASCNPQKSAIVLDETAPVTSLQIRLADGSRLMAKFNSNHTIEDVRQHIITQHPEYAGRNFVLQTTFPNRELTNETQTLESAQLLNAVLVQRLK